jgi:membrane associated rhomboid family serine protease
VITERSARRAPDWYNLSRLDPEKGPLPPVPYITACLVIANVFVFGYELSRSNADLQSLFDNWGVVSVDFIDWLKAPDISRQPFTVFTSAFLHGDWWHLMSNMAILLFLGVRLERLLVESFEEDGYLMFGVIYVLSIFGSIALQVGLTPNETTPVAGASGAIAGLAGAYLVTDLRGAVLIILWFATQTLIGVASLDVETNVAYFAHIGGFVTGCAAMLILAVWAFRYRGA